MTTSVTRASGLSTLLTATIGFRPIFSALPTTNLVCGIGPSAASTSTIATVDHRQDALDLAAEIGVAGRIDDVDALVSFQAIDVAFRHDRDAALPLEIVRIHHAFRDALVLAEGAGLLEQTIDEGGLAMIDVSDDGDVSQLHEKARFGNGGRAAPRMGAAKSSRNATCP